MDTPMLRLSLTLVALTVLVSAACTRGENRAPVAVITTMDGPREFYEGEQVLLDGGESYDPDGDALTYDWFEGLDEWRGNTAQLSFPAPRAVTPDDLSTPDTLVFVLRVTDAAGATAVASVAIRIGLPPGPAFQFTRLAGDTDMFLCRDAQRMGEQHLLLGHWDHRRSAFSPYVYFDRPAAERTMATLAAGQLSSPRDPVTRQALVAWIRDCLNGRLRPARS